MTEDGWRTTERGALAMCKFVRRRLSPRRVELLSIAVFRHLQPDAIRDPAVIGLLAAVDDFAEGRSDYRGFCAARDRALTAAGDHPDYGHAVHLLANYQTYDGVVSLVGWATGRYGGPVAHLDPRSATLCDLIREIAGNPFRPWKSIPETMGGGLVQPDGQTVRVTAAARAIAEGIAADQGFDRLPVLADALEDGGVTDAELLAHCRRPGGHLRGCWAVDVVRGRL